MVSRVRGMQSAGTWQLWLGEGLCKEFLFLLSMKLEGFEQRDGTALLYHNGLLLATVFH